MRRGALWRAAMGSVLFFATVALTVTGAMLIYGYADEKSGGDRAVLSAVMLLVILFFSIAFTVVDIVRRRVMVERPTRRILHATERIAAGDFSVRLAPTHSPAHYDEYDMIMENLNDMAEELGKSEMLKSDFVANVSHEFKTPLFAIRQYAGLLSREAGEGARPHADALLAATARLDALVTNVLSLNKLENQKLAPTREWVRVDETVAEAVFRFDEAIEKKGITLECDMEELRAYTSPAYLEIVWNNLLSNAVKFTPSGGQIGVRVAKHQKGVLVEISDTGCGISPEVGAHIFEKFYQEDTSHATEGNGLGLALVKKVIDLLGGEISVRSEVGKGSSFCVILGGETDAC